MIRDAIQVDAKHIANIYNYYIEHTTITFEETPVTANDIKQRINNIVNSGHNWLVAKENNRVLGYAYSSQWQGQSAYRYVAEMRVYLSHCSHTIGLGTKLYRALFKALRKQERRIALAGISLPNESSVAFHEKFGMRKIAHFKEVGFKHQHWIDVGYWQVDLNDENLNKIL